MFNFRRIPSHLSVPIVAGEQPRISPADLCRAAQELRGLYARHGVHLHPGSAVGRLVAGVEKLPHDGTRFLSTPVRNVFDSFTVIDLWQLLRVLDGHSKAQEYLRILEKDSLSSYSAGPSRAKDILWELQICARMRQVGLKADLVEPPDIVWTDGDKITGIACKKVYQDGRVQAAISKGVEQLAKASPYGFVALNIDEYAPAEKSLHVSSLDFSPTAPDKIIDAFCDRHAHHFQKYLSTERLSGVVVGLGFRTTVNRTDLPPAYFMTVILRLFTSPELPYEHRRRLLRLARWLERLPERQGKI